MRALNVAATGMMAQQLFVETISNNIANMTTTGYKRRRPEFQDLLYQSQRRIGSTTSDAGTVVPTGVQVGLGVKTAAVYRIHDQGDLVSTSNPLDVAIQGEGFFVIDLPDGREAYTRSGHFQISPDGILVNSDGYELMPGIQIPAEAIEVTINQFGVVQIKLAGQVESVEVGRIELATFVNPVGLEAIGNNLLLETTSSGPANIQAPGTEQTGTLLQGFVESSNVDPILEMTTLITAQRAYDLNSKVISAGDEMMASVTRLR
ncbi:MAG: flagellar basal-body rod protein FlgG [Geminicoccaceae bacterium]|nr:MAG: flagellar basal-body rod protein FlgG [Geminicoccaceae bacterium]